MSSRVDNLRILDCFGHIGRTVAAANHTDSLIRLIRGHYLYRLTRIFLLLHVLQP